MQHRKNAARLISTLGLGLCLGLNACPQQNQAPHRAPSMPPGAPASGPQTPPTTAANPHLDEWHHRWQQWQKTAPLNYRYVLLRDCYCTAQTRGPFVVQVQNGKVQTVQRIESQVEPQAAPSAYYSAPKREPVSIHLESYSMHTIMQDLRQKLERKPAESRIRYDARYGFPAEVMLDFMRHIADEEYGFRVQAFELQ